MTNLTSGGTVEQIIRLCAEGVLKPFCDLLAAKVTRLVRCVHNKFHNFLSGSGRFRTSFRLIRDFFLLSRIDKMFAKRRKILQK